MRYMLAAGILALASPASAVEPFVLAGKTGKLSVTFVGCRTKDNLARVKALFRADDRDAMVKFARSKAPDCAPISEGTVGMVDDISGWSGDSCIRPRGEPECYWVPMSMVVAP